jgi:hypothetical protein
MQLLGKLAPSILSVALALSSCSGSDTPEKATRVYERLIAAGPEGLASCTEIPISTTERATMDDATDLITKAKGDGTESQQQVRLEANEAAYRLYLLAKKADRAVYDAARAHRATVTGPKCKGR